ncbi:DeoR/GlpR family DNA-binding transcription regulator [Lederbergia sp. NSJ-179]|uniref:DeoR/GlpR family DNA-binding transcription regulator n=1 Tax=Lederbergia sp. NSJ-179 TaxID=2931402 RepID=UPI001FD15777|nr:DeoR/GlpR family DNA-binding transcription regulator [Lederbergia sp. NSJ-179]MCJ7842230.1 DeoR/GlpR family DNA-binding transcription regulator [Lederbergia sp. NSJ-179]
MSLLSEERKKLLIDEIDTHGKVRVSELAQKLNVSNETIRRDLEALEKHKKLKRVYGGAVKVSYEDGEPPYQQRQIIHYTEKKLIGRRAASLIKDGDTIFLDTGTTVLKLAEFIKNLNRLMILTNSLPAANVLKDSLAQGLFRGKVILLGGELSPDQQSVSGHLCEEMLKNFYVDKAFLSVGGVSLKNGISDYDFNESSISKLAATNAKEVIVLADHSKIGVQSFTKITTLDQVDAIICDKKQPPSWEVVLEQKNVDWIMAD